MGHGVDGRSLRARLDESKASSVAATLRALAAPSRLLILASLGEGPRTVSDIVAEVGMEQPAVSHQLRILHDLGFVERERQGRQVRYSLLDEHVAELILQAVDHAEHVHSR